MPENTQALPIILTRIEGLPYNLFITWGSPHNYRVNSRVITTIYRGISGKCVKKSDDCPENFHDNPIVLS